MKITLACFFGQSENPNPEITQRKDGQDVKMTLGEAMMSCFEHASMREFQPYLILLPELVDIYISNSDRELSANC